MPEKTRAWDQEPDEQDAEDWCDPRGNAEASEDEFWVGFVQFD